MHCNQKHKPADCPTLPKERKEWSWTRIFKARNGAPKPVNGGNPGGGKTPGSKRMLSRSTSNPGGENNVLKSEIHPGGGSETKRENSPKKNAKGKKAEPAWPKDAEADGVAVVAGIPGFYTCDGGCDQATIGRKYADTLEAAGKEVFYHAEPLFLDIRVHLDLDLEPAAGQRRHALLPVALLRAEPHEALGANDAGLCHHWNETR